MKKILIACRAYYPDIAGGGEISTKTLAETLVKIGFDVTVLTISDSDKDENIDGVLVHRVKYKNFYWSFKKDDIGPIKKIAWHLIDSSNLFIERELNGILSEVNPDVLITSTIEDISSIIWKVAKSKNIKTVHILRSYSLLCPNANMFKEDNCTSRCKLCKIITLPKKNNSKYVDEIVGISEFIVNKHLEFGYFPKSKKSVIYNICLENVIDKRIYDGFSEGVIKIGYLGRVHKTKGIEILFTSLGRIDSIPKDKIEVHIAGTGDESYIDELRILADSFGVKCYFLGNRNANEFLDSIDLLIVPSKWNEPFGRVLIESMGRHVPVAGRHVGGIPELLIDNKDFIFHDEMGLVKIINGFMSGQIKFNFRLQNFRTENIINKWSELLI